MIKDNFIKVVAPYFAALALGFSLGLFVNTLTSTKTTLLKRYDFTQQRIITPQGAFEGTHRIRAEYYSDSTLHLTLPNGRKHIIGLTDLEQTASDGTNVYYTSSGKLYVSPDSSQIVFQSVSKISALR